MGLITGLLGLPLAPVRGVGWVAGQLADEAERQLADPGPVYARLAYLESQLLAGEIDEDEFDRQEDELLDLLERSRRPPGAAAGP